jgi:hypothetical protein
MSHGELAYDAAPSIETILWIVVPLGFFFSAVWAFAILVLVARGKSGVIRERIVRDRKTGGPWVHYWLSIPGTVGNLIVLGMASFQWWEGAGTFQNSLYSVPLWWLPATLLMVSLPVFWLEKLVASQSPSGSR